ncbi:replication initiation and membrane attachment family protein [Mesomycoplasma molare]|uniref:Replicative helicase loading/DNA remodeling protein DnaB N-terminal winged helix domain-containing protein n=1 Tax=Mesomycoplasma molare TaxID=171288 RepID=A0ABY5TTW2_9BACT|nr:hypothetical protein [Mesomycoplasma molare]UWD34099.1 hypothetical protein NX772_03305 [Mesomycoplasma molare]
MKTEYKVELDKRITDYDFEIINNFYTPVIGAKSVYIFTFIYNKLKENGFNKPFNLDILELMKELNMRESQISKSKKFLEAVGLIRTYYSALFNEYIMVIKKPLEIDMILKNNLFLNEIKKSIGEKKLNNLIEKFRIHTTDLEEFDDVSTRFLDVFSIDEIKISNTTEIDLVKVNDNENAKTIFNTQRFLSFLTNKPAKISLVREIDKFLTHLSQESINEILDFCFKVNKKINKGYFNAIALDLIKKEILDPNEIKIELHDALEFKTGNSNNSENILSLEDEEEIKKIATVEEKKSKNISDTTLEELLENYL